MPLAVIALGSNVGDRLSQLRSGVAGLRDLGEVVAVSSLYETDPVGGPEQDRYLNAVAVVDTALEPLALLDALHRIEGDSDRVREVRWGPRTLDLDIVAYGNLRTATPELEIPHPRAHERHFVLAPLVEVRPETVLADGSRADEAVGRVAGQAVERWEGDWVSADPSLGVEAKWWVGGQVVSFALWLAAVLGSDLTPPSTPVLVIGAVLAVGGGVQGVAAVRTFGTSISPSPQPRRGSPLVSSGIYRRVRHPMYGAILLAFAGISLIAGSMAALGITVAVAAFFRAKAGREERILGIVLPGYSDYRRQVTKRFIPFVW
ncbi:MAG: 2-amino-4-hydroxy-6-hydroxymethyldihydropteridine diphosphokinase [Acidimicrobiia bacterium]|nr:2-amino-4-hydroxy-6-hydroxymethyldihydropteridine diphosphokinase [Acidimicrobiia bacterium]